MFLPGILFFGIFLQNAIFLIAIIDFQCRPALYTCVTLKEESTFTCRITEAGFRDGPALSTLNLRAESMARLSLDFH